MTTGSSTSQDSQASLATRMLIGAAIGLAVISFFVLGAPTITPPHWGQYWHVRPLIVEPLAGAMAGLCNYYILRFHARLGINKAVAIAASIVIGLIGLWMGIVLGLVGTMWN